MTAKASLSDERINQISKWVAENTLPTGRSFGVHAAAELLAEVRQLRTESPVRVTITLWDPDIDGPRVAHDGVLVWQDSGWGSFDQYLRWHAPKGVPIVLDLDSGGTNP